MYNTSAGIRVLQGAERRLVAESLRVIVDSLELDDLLADGPIVEDLTRNQKIATYHLAARALLAEEEPAPALTAVLEAAVANIYSLIRGMISQELDDADAELDEDALAVAPSWRELALAAGRELGLEELPSLDARDFDDWDLLLTCLEDQVLWDNDWAMMDHLDAAPDAARRVKRELGITEDYFVAVPRDPSDAEAERLLAELRMLAEKAC